MKKIQFVTAVHGNEILPVLALASINEKQTVANPKALIQNKRFLDKDMNASFGTGGNTYEEIRGRELLFLLDERKLIIDIHTFSAISEPFVVLVDLKMLAFARVLGFKNIVFMKHNIKKGHALINMHNGVSVEVGNHKDPKSFRRVIDLANRVKRGAAPLRKIILYEVFGKIKKPGVYSNFKIHTDGFIPILAGENAYDFYGLKARIIKEL